MKFVQAFRKLARNNLKGFDPGTSAFVDANIKCIFESSGRWISERVGFNARRVLLTEMPIYPTYDVVRIGDDTVDHILYSEQRNVSRDAPYMYDYTVLDKTNDCQSVTTTTGATASGMGGTKTETLSAAFPVHMVRFAATSSEEADHVDFSRLYAFAPGSIVVNEDMELEIDGDRYIVSEAVKELLCLRLSVTRR